MATTLILMLPVAGDIRQWWRAESGVLCASGTDGEWAELLAAEPGTDVVALAPAGAVPVRWLGLPELTPPQAAAAARAQMLDSVLGQGTAPHVAAGMQAANGLVPVAAVARDCMTQWAAMLLNNGITARALVPVTVLVPQPGADSVLRANVDGASLLRTTELCAEADPALDALRIASALVEQADAESVAAWLAALAGPAPLDLFTGDYAPRRASALDGRTQWWLTRLTAALAVLTLAVPLMQAWQLARSIDAADARSIVAAAAVGVRAGDAAAAELALDQRLASGGGGPLALSAPLGGLYQSLKDNPAVAVRTLTHVSNGTLGVTLASPRVEDVNAVLKALQARGYTITAQPLQGSDGMQMGTVTIRAVP